MSSTKKDIEALKRKIETARDKVLDEIEDVGEDAAALIKKRTRLGYGVSEHGARKEKLKPLADSYKKQRRGEITFRKKDGYTYPIKPREKPKLSSNTTAKRSNLTYSGEMLDDLHAKKTKTNTVEITFKTKESKKKAEYVSETRPFNFLSSSEIKQIREKIQKRIENILKKLS